MRTRDLATSLRVYLRLMGAALRACMQYRTSFWIRTVTETFAITEFIPVWFLMLRFGSLQGWTLTELALLYGMVGVSWAVVECLLRGFEDFGSYLIRGDVDRWLLRPQPIVLQVAAHELELRQLGRILQAAVVLIAGGIFAGVSATGWAWVALGVAGGWLFFTGVVMLGAAAQFWTLGQSSELQNILTYGGSTALTYPVSIYTRWFRRVITYAVPLAFVNYFPGLAALGRVQSEGWPAWIPWLSPLVCLGVLGLGQWAFALGLRRYESTGS